MPLACHHRSSPIRPGSRTLAELLLSLVLGWPSVSGAAGYAGRPLAEVLREFSAHGTQLIFSAETVPPDLRVLREPRSRDPLHALEEILAQHGLRVQPVGAGVYTIMVAAQAPTSKPAQPAAATAVAATASASTPLEVVVVSASRYTLESSSSSDTATFTQTDIDALPRFAEDPLKAIHRLPGAASNGVSGLAHMRGGDTAETQVIFDGLPLYEPFHLRLLQSPSSVLDERIVERMDVYSGGYTAEYGDRMSAIVDARSIRPDTPALTELGLSLFHANAVLSRQFADGHGRWLASVRRSNLDEIGDIVDSDLGESNYSDGFVRIDYDFSDQTRGSMHALLANDKATVSNAAGTESADARYENAYFWATLEHDWSPRLQTRALISYTDVSAERDGTVDEPGRRVGQFDDTRDYHVSGLKLDATLRDGRWLHRFGMEARAMSAIYAYTGQVDFAAGYPFPLSSPQQISRTLAPKPSGQHYSSYITSRTQVGDELTVEAGLRWDRETYGPDPDDELAPRLNLLWKLSPDTRLRASWGRYQQYQGIGDLQVEDGVDEFHRAQYADHAIIALEHELGHGTSTRIELYRKQYRHLQPRYESLFDPLSLAPELRWDRTLIAPSKATAEGLDWLFSRKDEGPWSSWINYSWSRVRDRIDGRMIRRSWDQTHALNGGVTWTRGGWQATLVGALHTGWPVTPVSIDANGQGVVQLGERNSKRFPNYASVDVRVSREFNVKRGRLYTFAEVTNALDRRNRCCVDIEADSTDNITQLDREYRNWLPLIPSAGISWRF